MRARDHLAHHKRTVRLYDVPSQEEAVIKSAFIEHFKWKVKLKYSE